MKLVLRFGGVSSRTTVVSHPLDRCVQGANRELEKGLVIPGELAVQCLREMPFEKKRAVSFVKEYRKYLQYQSTLEILENPPSHYPMPPAHLLGGLDDIQKKADTGFYTNQFDFDAAIKELLKSAYDGHLGAKLCSHQWFDFKTDTPLVSISSNGTTLPKVYTYGMMLPPP